MLSEMIFAYTLSCFTHMSYSNIQKGNDLALIMIIMIPHLDAFGVFSVFNVTGWYKQSPLPI